MESIRSEPGALPDLRPIEAALAEHAEILHDLRVAEEQVARGEAVEHDDAKRQVLARLQSGVAGPQDDVLGGEGVIGTELFADYTASVD